MKITFSVGSDEQGTFERCFAGVMARENRREMIVPLVREVDAAFLNPAVEIRVVDLIWGI